MAHGMGAQLIHSVHVNKRSGILRGQMTFPIESRVCTAVLTHVPGITLGLQQFIQHSATVLTTQSKLQRAEAAWLAQLRKHRLGSQHCDVGTQRVVPRCVQHLA